MESTGKHFRKRDAILNYLRSTDEHPSAEMVLAHVRKEIPDLSLGTVYRNLALFKQQGLVMSLGSIDGVERFDGNVNPHVHFVCRHCGAVRDLHSIALPEELLAQAEAFGKIEQWQLTFTGSCGACG